jgi:hypothetical protein
MIIKTPRILFSTINFDRDSLKKKIAEEKKKNKLTNTKLTNSLDDTCVKKIIDQIQTKFQLETFEDALMLITGLLQRGGTNKSAGKSTNFTLNQKTISAQELQNIITRIASSATNRQLARAIADTIAEISMEMGLEGDLANQMRYEYPELTPEEAVWCSNFQTTNKNCPERVRVWLVNNYRSRFNR